MRLSMQSKEQPYLAWRLMKDSWEEWLLHQQQHHFPLKTQVLGHLEVGWDNTYTGVLFEGGQIPGPWPFLLVQNLLILH